MHLSFPRSTFMHWKQKNLDINWLTLIVSIFISLWVILTDDIINNDGILYLKAAELFLAGDWKEGYATYSWPFYPMLIAMTGKLTGISLENSAFLLNTLFLALFSFTFIALIREIGGDRRTLIFGAAIILTLPYLNDGRSEIIRDHGYWLLYLIAVFFFYRHYQSPGWRSALIWNISILLSMLFRIEGMVILLLLPLVILSQKSLTTSERLVSVAQAYFISILVVAGLFTLIYIYPEIIQYKGRILDPLVLLKQFWDSIFGGLSQKAEFLSESLLPPFSSQFAMPSILAILALIITGKTITALSPLHSLLLLIKPLHVNLKFQKGAGAIIIWLCMTNLFILFIFVITSFYLQARYTMPLAIALLLLIPFILVSAQDIWRQRRSRPSYLTWVFPIAIAVLVYMGGDSLMSTSPSKKYVKELAEWIQQNVASGSNIYTNYTNISYYTNRGLKPSKQIHFFALPPEHPPPNSYFAIYMKRYNPPPEWPYIQEQFAPLFVKIFENRRGDGIHLFQITRPEKNITEKKQIKRFSG